MSTAGVRQRIHDALLFRFSPGGLGQGEPHQRKEGPPAALFLLQGICPVRRARLLLRCMRECMWVPDICAKIPLCCDFWLAISICCKNPIMQTMVRTARVNLEQQGEAGCWAGDRAVARLAGVPRGLCKSHLWPGAASVMENIALQERAGAPRQTRPRGSRAGCSAGSQSAAALPAGALHGLYKYRFCPDAVALMEDNCSAGNGRDAAADVASRQQGRVLGRQSVGRRSTSGRTARLRRGKTGVAGAVRLQLSFLPVSSTAQPYRCASTPSQYP